MVSESNKASNEEAAQLMQQDKATEENSESEEGTAPEENPEEMSDERKLELALKAKQRGNKYFQGKKFEKAISLYSKAIQYYSQVSGGNGAKNCAVFYCNRAACYANLDKQENVIEDCTAALELDPFYAKAFARRSAAKEKLGELSDALSDMTYACILEDFKNQSFLNSADRVLKALAFKKADEHMKTQCDRESLPSLTFVTAYLKSFRYEYLSEEDMKKNNLSEGDSIFIKAFEAFKKKDWEKADELCCKAYKKGCKEFLAECANMSGTFNFLKGKSEEAKKDFEKSLEAQPDNANSHIKMASLFMEKSQDESSLNEALKCFEKALQHKPEDPDIYYHRGQIYFLTQDYDNALLNYDKSIALDPNFLFAEIQKAVALYRSQRIDEAEQVFVEAEKRFPDSPDVSYYHGEILLDSQKIEESLSCFDKAIQLDSSQPLPYLNKGIIQFHLKNEVVDAIKNVEKALEVDPRCDLAYVHLGQMYLHQCRFSQAMLVYKKALELARGVADAENAILGMESVKMQIQFTELQQKRSNRH